MFEAYKNGYVYRCMLCLSTVFILFYFSLIFWHYIIGTSTLVLISVKVSKLFLFPLICRCGSNAKFIANNNKMKNNNNNNNNNHNKGVLVEKVLFLIMKTNI